MKRFALIVGVLCLSAAAAAEPIEVTARAIPLSDADPAVVTVGALSFRGGLVLSSPDRRFGGFSALGVSADGRRMVTISDAGASLSATVEYDGDGQLSGISNVDMGALAGPDGEPLVGKYWTDAESMSPGVSGEIIVSFERDHRIWRYDPGEVRPRALRPPDELSGLDENDGIEALTLLNDGRLLAIAEGDPAEPATVAWVSRHDGWDVMIYVTGDGFRPTGAATLPGGDVLVLERYYTPRNGVRIRIKRVAVSAFSAAAELSGEVIAQLAPPMNVDNFEGIEVRSNVAGGVLVYLISDDNFSSRQRTLLMMFEMAE